MEAAVEFAASRGARIVEAYPVDVEDGRIDAGSAFTGIAATFAQAGFSEVAGRSPRRPIMRRVIE